MLFSAAVKNKKENQFFRFIIIGIFNTGVSYFIYSLMIFLGFSFVFSNFIALILGILISFKTQGRFVFNSSNNFLLWRFIILWFIIYIAATTLIGIFISYGLNAYISGIMTLPFSTTLSFLGQKYFVFRKSEPSKN